MGNKASNSAAVEADNSNEGRSSSSHSSTGNGNSSANVDDVFIETDEDLEEEGEISRDPKKVGRYLLIILLYVYVIVSSYI